MEFYSIGEVSKRCNISVKTLRYYDEIDLLKPDYIAEGNHYRYYTKENMLKIPLIKYYKQLGFRLEDIRQLIQGPDIHELERFFAKELKAVERQIDELQNKHFAITEWRRLLKQGEDLLSEETAPSAERADIQTIPLYRTMHYKYKLEEDRGFNDLLYSNPFVEICRRYDVMAYGPFMLYFGDIEQRINNTYTEIDCYTSVIENDSRPGSTVSIGDFQAVTAIHKGSYETLRHTYQSTISWAAEHRIPLQGTALERNIIDPWSTPVPDHFVTELILPISVK